MSQNGAPLLIELLDEVHRLRGRFISVLTDIRSSIDLSPTENMTLSAVVNASRPPTVPQIGRSLGHPRQVIQRAVDRLIERALVEAIGNPDHKRAHLLVATPQGQALHGDAHARALVMAARVVDGMDTQALADAVATLRVVRTRLQQADAMPMHHPNPT
jgi:DNA-binding MarR family transcriptional regulator